MKDPADTRTAELADLPPPRRPGRPRIYANAAERQRAYRERLAERGLREVRRVVRDVREPQPLRSDVIALDHIPEWRR